MIDIRLDGDNGVLVWSDEVGVRIFNIDPLAEIGRLDTGSTLSGKVQWKILGIFYFKVKYYGRFWVFQACNIGRTNIVSLIGGGERPKFSQNSLVLYDAVRGEPAMDITFGIGWKNSTILSRKDSLDPVPKSVGLAFFSRVKIFFRVSPVTWSFLLGI